MQINDILQVLPLFLNHSNAAIKGVFYGKLTRKINAARRKAFILDAPHGAERQFREPSCWLFYRFMTESDNLKNLQGQVKRPLPGLAWFRHIPGVRNRRNTRQAAIAPDDLEGRAGFGASLSNAVSGKLPQ